MLTPTDIFKVIDSVCASNGDTIQDLEVSIDIKPDYTEVTLSSWDNSLHWVIDEDSSELNDFAYSRGELTNINTTNMPIEQIANTIIEHLAPLPTVEDMWKVTYQYEALPWHQWGVETASKFELDKYKTDRVFTQSVCGLTSVDNVIVSAVNPNDALNTGGNIILEWLKEHPRPCC